MSKSSTRGIFLSVVLLVYITLVTIPPNVYSEEILVTSIALEETSILEVVNNSNEKVDTLRIWLGSGFNFESFKTEKGWIGEENSQGVIVFTSSEAIKLGESVKFGVKTDKPNPNINWKVLDKEDTEIGIGMSVAKELQSVYKEPEQSAPDPDLGASMTTESTFRIIPEKPNVGSSIRVTGENFGALQEFDFYIDTKKITTVDTDANGHFMTTVKIPDNQKADRADFKIKNEDGEEKKISLRIGEVDNRVPTSENIPLTIKGIPNIVNRGDLLEIFGTGNPGSAVTAEVTTAEGDVINSRTAEIDSKGDWKLDEPVAIPLDTPFGKYSAVITDGRESKLISWTVESDKKINIVPTTTKFEAGELMIFNGTALPNKPIEVIIEDPLGKDIFSDIIQINGSGSVGFEFQTTQTTPEGTYTLIATQEKEKEFIYVGLGQLPVIPVNLEFDKFNYKSSETALITLSGKASEIVSLLILDPSDRPKGNATSITLQPDGRGSHSIDLNGFTSGAYTAVVSKGTAQNTEIFTVGLQVVTGEIKINTTKIDYRPGDSILILGDTDPNVLLTLTLLDSDGNEVKIKETFSDKDGKISASSFRIPSDGISGKWIINAKSGSNFDNAEIEVLATSIEGMIVSVEDGQVIPGVGDSKNILVFGGRQTIQIEIIAEDGEVIAELSFPASKDGEINQPWIIPKETEPGTYTIKVSDAFNSVETTFEIQ